MKILFTNDNLIGGGAEKLLNDLLPLINEKHSCDLLILTWKNEKYRNSLQEKGIRIEAIPETIKSHYGKVRYIKKFIKRGEYDIVHANEFPMFYYCSFAIRMMRKKPALIVTEHNISNRRRKYRLLRPLERLVYKAYDRVISISPQAQDALTDWLNVQTSPKYVTVYNGVPLDVYKNSGYADRKELFPDVASGDVLLCTVARLAQEKNHALLFDAMEKLPSNYKLILCGDGELFEYLKADAERRCLNDRIRFLGFRNDVPEVMKASDIIVIPSKWEAFGLIAVEAMACGKPIVCADIPGLSEVVDGAGIKVRPDDADEFAQAIISVSDEAVKERLISYGRKQCERYDILNVRDGYLRIYEELIK